MCAFWGTTCRCLKWKGFPNPGVLTYTYAEGRILERIGLYWNHNFFYFFLVGFLSQIQRKARDELEPWLQTLHLSCPTFMGGLYLEPCFGPYLELFKTEALYKSEFHTARGISLPWHHYYQHKRGGAWLEYKDGEMPARITVIIIKGLKFNCRSACGK